MSVKTKKHPIPLITVEWLETKKTLDWHDSGHGDSFDDSFIGPEWTSFGTGAGRTITEKNGIITLAIEAGINGRWWCITDNNAPRIYKELPSDRPARIEIKLNEHTVNSHTFAGLMIAREPTLMGTAAVDPAYAYWLGRYRCITGGWNGIYVMDQCGNNGGVNGAPWDTLPQWYRIDVDESNNVMFYGSPDGVNWTNIWGPLAYDYDPLYMGLVSMNWWETGVWAARAAPFAPLEEKSYGVYRKTVPQGYAPIDARARDTFYSGRILNVSGLKRGIDDKTGLFQASDLTITLANSDKEFSKLLASHILKNQKVILYHHWTEQPESSKTHVCTMIVEDHSLKGVHFNIKLQDITKKYFTKNVPAEICTKEKFPNIHPDHIGRRMPEILGNAELGTEYEHPGAVEAVYVDTFGHQYLAAAGILTAVPKVYSDDALMATPADYSIIYSGGRTLIDFTGDQGDNTIAFDAHGYSFPAWDSANGYIQNLAYIIEYFLCSFMGIPLSFIDLPSFAETADHFTDIGEHESCYLILQDKEDVTEVLRQLLFTGGTKCFIAMDGKIKLGYKGLDNWQVTSLDSHLAEQLHLFDHPERQWNLVSAINTIKARYGYIPWQRIFKSTEETYKSDDFEIEGEEITREDYREMPKEV